MSKWFGNEKLFSNLSGVANVGAVTTALTPSIISAINPSLLRVDVVVSAVSVAGSVTLNVEHLVDNTTWVAVKTLAITASGLKTITINPITDAAILPLSSPVRVSVTGTNAADSVTFTSVFVHRIE